MPVDDALQPFLIPAPRKGLMEGIDPAVADFDPNYAPELVNLRVLQGLFNTRKGMVLDDPDSNPATLTFGATGICTDYWTYYRSNGDRYRLVLLGGVLKERLTSNTAFSNSPNGSGFSTARLAAVLQLADYVYITDKAAASALKRWEITTGVTTVASPAAPSAAPRTKPWTYGYLDLWPGAAPFGWAQSDGTHFFLAVPGSDGPDFPTYGWAGAASAKIHWTNNNCKNATLTKNATYPLNSSAIAFWVYSSGKNNPVGLQIGINAADDFVFFPAPLPEKETEYVFFAPVGDLPSIAYLRWKVTRDPGAANSLWVSSLYLPGLLEGKYRYRYTHYNPTTGGESEPSAINNGGEPVDLSVPGISYKNETARAFQKSIMLDFTTDSGVDATTTKIRIYRNGGVPSLTKDGRGQDVWLKVGEIYDHSTTLSSSPSAAATSFTLTAVGPVVAGDWLVVKKGSATEEYVLVSSVAGSTINFLKTPLKNGHSSGEACQIAFLDNTSNQALAGSVDTIDAERDGPPTGIHWLARLPNGRMIAFRWDGEELGVAYSNQPTTVRPFDHEVFPDGVDPIARGNPTQGFRIRVDGDASGDEIMWGGVFRDLPTVLTRRALYQIEAYSQDQFSPTSVRKVFDTVGCAAGDTVRQIGGYLYWVADGPRVMRWDGQSEPEDISWLKLTSTCENAPAGSISKWFATARSDKNGIYYILFVVPSGQTTATLALFFNVVGEAWEPCIYYDSNGALLAWATATVFDGASDARELMAVQGTSGAAYQLESGTADNGVAIATRMRSKRFHVPGGLIADVVEVYLRGAAVSDTMTITVKAGGSEYGDTQQVFSGKDFSGTGGSDKEVYAEVAKGTVRGRWMEIQMDGVSDASLAVRECEIRWASVRKSRMTA